MKIFISLLVIITISQSKTLKSNTTEYKEYINVNSLKKCPSEDRKYTKSNSKIIYLPNTKHSYKNGIKITKVYGLNKYRERTKINYSMCINEKNTIVIENIETYTIEDI